MATRSWARLARLRRTAAWLAMSGVAAMLLSGCQGGAQNDQDSDPGSGEVSLEHIHGLGINPADGELYVASHHGVFLVTGQGAPEQIANRTQDFMGFTVVGPDHFLGSGHPGPQDTDQPPNVGLIESTDAATSWHSLSLSGEVDFHALEAKHGKVYGYDSLSGQIMVSDDKETWDKRAGLPLADIAVSPDDPDVVLATTQQGPARSTDGGRSFTPIDGAPVLIFLDWPGKEVLVGVSPDGVVYVSDDGGTGWTEQGRVPGGPQAILAHGKSEMYVATDEGIQHSTDNGKTFTVLQPLA
ncbi:MAG: F510_1955 family glycosylhydrolase [Haloechinothrix sp.]